MKKCLNCTNDVPPSSRKYCSINCMKMFYQKNLKYVNPNAYKKRLESAKKSRREKVRKRLGLPLDYPQINQSGKGFKIKDGYKYILKKDHPNAAKSGYVAEHIVIMSNHLRRPLKKGETIHHKNGIRDDNRIENLELWVNTIRFGQRLEDKINWCIIFLESYGYVIQKL